MTWRQIGTVGSATDSVAGAVAFARGYVAWGTALPGGDAEQASLAAWYSADGKTWQQTLLSTQIAACAGPSVPDLSYARTGVTDGTTVVLFASLMLPGAGVCPYVERSIAISTTDGRTWTRTPFGPAAPYLGPAAAYRVNGEWEVLVGVAGSRRGEIWHSRDAVAWSRLGAVALADSEPHAAAATSSATRLLAAPGLESAGQLLASTDGATWRAVHTLPAGQGVGAIVPPATPGRPWLVFVGDGHDPLAGVGVLASVDLRAWTSTTFPRPYAAPIRAAAWGWVVLGETPYDCTPGPCDPPGPPSRLYKSVDARTWSEWGADVPPGSAPAGGGSLPLMLARTIGDGRVTLYELVMK